VIQSIKGCNLHNRPGARKHNAMLMKKTLSQTLALCCVCSTKEGGLVFGVPALRKVCDTCCADFVQMPTHFLPHIKLFDWTHNRFSELWWTIHRNELREPPLCISKLSSIQDTLSTSQTITLW
jgi:hypothetical protein